MKIRLLVALFVITLNSALVVLSAQSFPEPTTWDNAQAVPPVGMTFFEGDILMPLHSGMETAQATYEAKLWTNGVVYYEFAADISSNNRAAMRAAMDELQMQAGVTFVPRSGQANYIKIHDDDGNSSAVGMQGGMQTLSIVSWSQRYIIIHELMHALGMWHEQSRTDREQYITINYNNIQDGFKGNFNVAANSRTVGGYDFCSVMHYGGLYFSKNGQPTISAKPGYEQFQSCMGNQSSLTEQDKAGLLVMYPNNRLNNGSFENGLTAWTFAPNAANCASTVIGGGVQGASALAMNARSGAVCGSLVQDVSRTLAAGENYTFSVMARVASGTRNARLVLTALGGTAEVVAQPVALDTMWRCYAVTLPVGLGGHTGLRAEFATDLFSGLQDYNLDDARLTMGANSPCAPFADRNMAGNADFAAGLSGWTGSNSAASLLAQNTGYNLPANGSVELRVSLANSASTAQTVTVTTRNIAGTDTALSCTFTIPAASTATVYTLRGKTNAFWQQARLEITLPAGGLLVNSVDFRALTMPVTATQCATPELPGNLPQTAMTINSDRYATQTAASAYTVKAGSPLPTCAADGLPVTHTVWYTLTPTQDRLIDIFATGYDTVLAVYSGQPGSLTQIACADQADSAGTEWLNLPVSANSAYYIVAGSRNGSVGTLSLKVTSVRNLLAESNFEWEAGSWKQVIVPATRADDVRVCGNTGAHGTNCALRFKGGQGEGSAFKQTIRPANWDIAAGSDLWLGYMASSTAKKTKVRLNATITFSDGSKQKIIAPDVVGSTGGRYVFNTATAQLSRADVSKIVVTVKNKSKGGVTLVDNVVFAAGSLPTEYAILRNSQPRDLATATVQSQDVTGTTEILGLLPPPAAPEGFRGQN